jgi:hypothetical protein
MEAMADIMEYAIDNQILCDLTFHSNDQVAISDVRHTGTGTGQDRAIRVVEALERRLNQDWHTKIGLVPGHCIIFGNERANHLASMAASK